MGYPKCNQCQELWDALLAVTVGARHRIDGDGTDAEWMEFCDAVEKAELLLDKMPLPTALVEYGKDAGLICKQCGYGVNLCKCIPTEHQAAGRPT